MNWKQQILRTLGLMAIMFAPAALVYAQPGGDPDSTKNDVEEIVEEAEEEMDSASEEVVVKMDTTEIAWRDKKFVIISEDGVKRVEIIDIPKDEQKNNDDDDNDWNWDDEGFDPEYETKTRTSNNSGYSNVGLVALDLGFINFYSPEGIGADAITASPDLEVRDFRFGSHVALHLFPTTVSLIGRGAVNLQSAITIDWSNYYFKGNNVMVETESGFEWQDTGREYDKNKLTVRYAQIPLMLNINSDPRGDDGVSISAGGYIGLLWNTHTKQVTGGGEKFKTNGDFGLTRFRYGLMGRIDFKWFDFYVMYNLTPMFKDENPTNAQTVVAGVNIINF